MAERCLLCYITGRSQFPGEESGRKQRLLQKIAEAARCGMDFIQLREKDLPTPDLEALAREAVAVIHRFPAETGIAKPETRTRLLINSRTDVALAAGADGVHLRSDDISVHQVRDIWAKSHRGGADALARGREERIAVVSVSCHSADDVCRAAEAGADFAVFAPVFEKKGSPETRPAGLDALRRACQQTIPDFALGGVTLGNARFCLEAGAAGIAGIRLFQENDIRTVVESIRAA